jgi:ribosomal protein S18 acetylase RimI-like enzyme
MDWFAIQDFLSQVEIRPFEREDQIPAKQLILNGLAEHWGWLDPRKNPDLDDIASFYTGGIFLVAEKGGEIVGTGGLLPGDGEQAQIMRVHVAEHYRRLGLGTLIVNELCKYARQSGFKTVVLETTETWEDAVAFYAGIGFHVTHHLDGDVYMAKQLNPPSPGAGEDPAR